MINYQIWIEEVKGMTKEELKRSFLPFKMMLHQINRDARCERISRENKRQNRINNKQGR